MTIFDKLASVKSAASVMAVNFWPWLLAAFLLGAGTAGWGGFSLARAFYRGEALEARLQLSQFRTDLAEAARKGEESAATRQREAMEALRARDDATSAAVAAIPSQVARSLRPMLTKLEESLRDPAYDCLRQPMPSDALRLLERSGGVAPSDR